jgi:hypothetical protein
VCVCVCVGTMYVSWNFHVLASLLTNKEKQQQFSYSYQVEPNFQDTSQKYMFCDFNLQLTAIEQ